MQSQTGVALSENAERGGPAGSNVVLWRSVGLVGAGAALLDALFRSMPLQAGQGIAFQMAQHVGEAGSMEGVRPRKRQGDR